MIYNFVSLLFSLFFITNINSSIHVIDRYTISFNGNAVFQDPGNKYKFVLYDKETIPTWLFVVRKEDKKVNIAWKHERHSNEICNVFNGNKILIHLLTIGIIKSDLLFSAYYKVDSDNNDKITSLVYIDKSYKSRDIDDLYFIITIIPYKYIDKAVYLEVKGYIKSKYMIGLIPGTIKWYMDNILQNLGERFMAVK